GLVSPNPMVGCVIVHRDKIIGEGWHQQFGGPHAEVNAIQSVEEKELLPESTLYVNLEPCHHYGKTPPCVDLIIEKKIKKVVIANEDPFSEVSGKSIKKMREQKIEVVVGTCEEEGEWLNQRFFTFQRKKRPYIILKWAQTADGFIARKNYNSKWISNAKSRKLVHKWRSEEPAIFVGYNTALYDDPALNVRHWDGQNPVRIVLDPAGKLPATLKLFDQNQPTVVYSNKKKESQQNICWEAISQTNAEEEILSDLYKRKLQSVIIEGGAATINSFLKKNLWDEARVFIGNQTFSEGIEAPKLNKSIFAEEMIAGYKLLIYKNE
ncbi:MAG: bifunctional diaminohydroxyphosphoribosylaminopyrimidine deaminase/5-amino-6-(5-phosphoribosylamino)uracil reductase RibD, partial [Fulvivirga sp.]|nr:bifunctional diaminohydroxyphosphoribosylaminopyrimidine deaminase/5-amino-6-(5-phosphoribosylamino)uracil reductase RibD [Fulvivirga sp.]